VTNAAAEQWRTFRGPGAGMVPDSFVTFVTRSPVMAVTFRDSNGQIWLGWADLTVGRFDVTWKNLGGPFIRGPFVQTVGAEAVIIVVGLDGDVSFAVVGEPSEPISPANWKSLGLAASHNPRTVSWGTGRIDVFGLGEDGIIRQTWLERQAEGWTARGQWVPVAEQVTEMPAPVSWGPQRLDLFGRSPKGSVLHKWWDDAADRLDIFQVENTSKTTHKYWHPGTGWLPAPPTQWEDIGGPLSTRPAVVSWGSYHLDLFGRGPDGHLCHLWWGPESGWEPADGWEDMHGVLASGPVAFAWGRDRLGVFAISVENTLIYKYRDPGIFWRPSLVRWYESGFPGAGRVSPRSLRAAIAPGGLAVISAVEDSLDHAHVGIFHP
jgi:Repeat of unknown function (DUF346)